MGWLIGLIVMIVIVVGVMLWCCLAGSIDPEEEL